MTAPSERATPWSALDWRQLSRPAVPCPELGSLLCLSWPQLEFCLPSPCNVRLVIYISMISAVSVQRSGHRDVLRA